MAADNSPTAADNSLTAVDNASTAVDDSPMPADDSLTLADNLPTTVDDLPTPADNVIRAVAAAVDILLPFSKVHADVVSAAASAMSIKSADEKLLTAIRKASDLVNSTVDTLTDIQNVSSHNIIQSHCNILMNKRCSNTPVSWSLLNVHAMCWKESLLYWELCLCAKRIWTMKSNLQWKLYT